MLKSSLKYFFKERLIRGVIRSRPNRFIMFVDIDGKIEKCHCPATGRIGNILFKDIPCLLSRSNNLTRKTKYTVEAIIVSKKTIGINQTKANTYIDFFLKNKLLNKMINVSSIKREQKLANSRIDFLINDNCLLEVKTPLRYLPFGKRKDDSKFSSFDRLDRHFREISLQIKNGKQAIVLICYMYNAKKFNPPRIENSKTEKDFRKSINKSLSRGLEHWQINLKIDRLGVSLIDYFKLELGKV